MLITRRAALGAALALSALSSMSAAHAADKPTVIRIGSTAPGHLKFILAQQNGWLEKEFAADGIEVELVAFTGGGSEATTALATGGIDFTYTGSNPALRVAASGANVKLVGLSSYVKSSGQTIVVRKDSPIKTIADLKGKKVAYLAGTVRHSVLAKALKSAGLTTKDIESLNLNFEASGPALVRGDIDALVESDNTASRLVETGEARVLVDGNDHPDWAAPYAISVNGDFAAKYPDIVKRVLKTDVKLSKWADTNYDQTIKIFVDATKASEKSVRANYSGGVFNQDPKITEDAIKGFKEEEAFMAEAGQLKGSVNYDKLVDRSFVDAAYIEAGY